MPYSMQLTEQIPDDPPMMGAKNTTTSNHPSTLRYLQKKTDSKHDKLISSNRSKGFLLVEIMTLTNLIIRLSDIDWGEHIGNIYVQEKENPR